MADVEDKLDIERVSNLIMGFGWRITKQETLPDRLILTVEKTREPTVEEQAGVPA